MECYNRKALQTHNGYVCSYCKKICTAVEVRDSYRAEICFETPEGETVVVSQITGLIARRIVCHPVVGEFVERRRVLGRAAAVAELDALIARCEKSERMTEAGD